jgi:sec-independent protein translocase protein TatB
MFDIGWSELVVIGIVALIAIGPKELPGVLRAAGQWVGKMRKLAAEFQGQFQEAMREAEMADLKKQFEEVGDIARDLDPLATVQKEIQSAVEDKPAASEGTPTTGESEVTATAKSAAPADAPADTAAALARSTAGETAATADIPLPEAAPPVTEADFVEAQPKPKARAKRKPKAPKVEAEDESA